MKIPAGSATVELSIKASRFIGQSWPVSTRREVDSCLEAVRRKHPGASHVVYAFVLGAPESELLGQSDAGEPHGTAGRPILEILRGSGVRNCLITVVRFFGGTKLGTGGLVHAYGDTAREVLAQTPIQEHRILLDARLTLSYALHEQIQRILPEHGVEIRSETFLEHVELELGVPEASLGPFRTAIQDVSRGTLSLEVRKDPG